MKPILKAKDGFDILVKLNGESPVNMLGPINYIKTYVSDNYKRGNNLYQCQLIYNGTGLEFLQKETNPILEFIEQNHEDWIPRETGHGNFIPDFKFTVNDRVYTFESKTFFDTDKFNNKTYKNFEGADFVCAFIMSENKFYFRYKKANSEEYTKAATFNDLSNDLKDILYWYKSPKQVLMINFYENQDKDNIYAIIPHAECINYRIDTYNVTE